MKIMLADYDRNRLDRLSEYIRELFPYDDITAETDSLMAAKNCFSTPYDIVFASLDDRRLDGLKMKGFVRHSNAQAKFCICGNAADLREWGVTDNYGNITHKTLTGFAKTLQDARKLRVDDGGLTVTLIEKAYSNEGVKR